jgi:hypothetical protein
LFSEETVEPNIVLVGVQTPEGIISAGCEDYEDTIMGRRGILHLWFTSEARTTYRVLCIVVLLFTITAHS